MPFASVAATGFAAICVGIAEGFVAEWTRYTRARSSRGTSVASLAGTQIDLGHAAIEIDAARRLYLGAAQDAMATLSRGEKLSEEQRLRARLSASMAAQLALGAVQRLFNAAGGRVGYSTNVLQRQLRDLQVAAAHISIVWNNTTAAYGGHLLGAGG